MVIPRELLNIVKNGNHHILRHGVVFLFHNKKLVLVSHMTEHEWFQGILSEMALR